MAVLQKMSFRTASLEEKFQRHQPLQASRLPKQLCVCVALWAMLRAAHLAWYPSTLTWSWSKLAWSGSLMIAAAVGLHGGPQWWEKWRLLTLFAAAWVMPDVASSGPWGASPSLPGRTASLLALALNPAFNTEALVAHAGPLLCLLAAASLCTFYDSGSNFEDAALVVLVCVAVGSWGCQLQQGLEHSHRELFLCQYRAASKAQHFRLLLDCLLPEQIVEPYFERCMRFEGGGGLLAAPIAHQLPAAGVLFMAIDAFDRMAISHTPMDLIQFLNRLFTSLDCRCGEAEDLVKIETVGEVYVAASGLFDHQASPNISALAHFALRSREEASDFGVELRMGIHCGPLVAGIIGDKLPRYRLFGDTVNTAARLEQNCIPSHLLVSTAAAEHLRSDWELSVEKHGKFPMKGLGEVETFHVERACTGKSVGENPDMFSSRSADSSPNLTKFLMTLPELGILDDLEPCAPTPNRIHAPKTPMPQPPPLISPLWDYLDQGLKDPDCIEKECPPGKATSPRQALNKLRAPPPSGTPLHRAAPGHRTNPREPPPETPTSWLSPGKQLVPRGKGVFLPKPAESTLLPTVVEGQTHSDDVSDDQLESLVRRTDAACRSAQLPFFGSCRFLNAAEEACFRETRAPDMHQALCKACLYAGVLCLVAVAIKPVSAGSVASLVLLTACYVVARSSKKWQLCWLPAQVAPVALSWALSLALGPEYRTARELGLCALVAGAVHAQLLCSGTLVLGFCGSSLLYPPWDLLSLSQAVAVAALALTGIAREDLSRRCFASDRLCRDLLDRLQTVAEDLLPPTVVSEMRCQRFGTNTIGPKQGLGQVVHSFPIVSILQTDLVGFTAIARTLQPEDVLRLLNELFVVFDQTVGTHHVFKMETVGDAYICASGLPDFGNGEHRPKALLRLALDLHHAAIRYRQQNDLKLGLRAGLHSGPAIGGVVGTTMQRYHLFGGTMHITEKLEATAPSGAVHLSEALEDADESCCREQIKLCSVEKGTLTTSKGELVPQCEVGGAATYVVWPTSAPP